MAKSRDIPRVEVTWIDSAFHRGWDSREDKSKQMEPTTCRTVGYLVKNTKLVVALCQSTSDQSLSDGIAIPRCAVRRIRRLRG